MLQKINPTCKCIGVLVPALLLSFSYKISLNLVVLCICLFLLLLSRISPLRIVRILLPVSVAAFGLFMTGFLFSSQPDATLGSSIGQVIVYPASVGSGLQISTRILAFAGLGMVFSLTTQSKLFVYSLEQQLHLPSRFAYGVLAALHLAPLLPYEYKKTSQAFLARGQKFFSLSPKVLVPFIIKSVRWSESLAIAMESKAFDQDGSRTHLQIITVHWFDYVFAILPCGLTLLGVLL